MSNIYIIAMPAVVICVVNKNLKFMVKPKASASASNYTEVVGLVFKVAIFELRL